MRSTYITAAVLSMLGVALAADCFPQQDDPLNTDDIQAVASTLATNNLNPTAEFPLLLKAMHHFGFNIGGVLFCVENNFLFDNTHVAQEDLVNAVQDLHDQCGSIGGKYQVLGDSGLATDVVIASTNSDFCK